ncbi:MAG: hypothetical protein C0599_12745 [Salinivirgaceae bacterium]|nr:MAG: hypothetical protein C0599_12745 [Salinivirgaceae bacterium]
MKKVWFLVCFCISLLSFSQNSKIDSLKNVLQNYSDSQKKFEVLLELSKQYRTQSLDSAFNFANKAKAIAYDIDDEEMMAQACLELGNIHLLKGETSKAIALYDEGIEVLDSKNDNILNNLISNKGNAYIYSGKLDQGLTYYIQVLDYWKELKDTVKIADMMNNIGVVNIYRGDYNKAMEHLIESVNLYEKIGNWDDATTTLGNIGQIYNEIEEYDKALKYSKKALKVSINVNDLYQQAGLLLNIVNIYKSMDSLEQSIIFCRRALSITEKNNYTTLSALVYSNLGLVYEKQKRYKIAVQEIEKSLDIAKVQEDLGSQVKSMFALGRLYTRMNNFKLALKHLDKSERLAKQIGLFSDYFDIYFEKYEAYNALNDFKNAIHYYKKYVTVKDSIFNEKKHRQITEIETKYETAKKEKELLELSKENSHQKVLILKNRYFNYSLIAFIFFVIAISLLLFRQNRLKNSQKTLELEQQLFRSQMNPHFIFNSISSIQYYITTNKPLEASSYLADFAKLMRLVIENSREEFISMEQEIDTIKYYLEMQKLRYEDSFDYELEIDDNLNVADVMIPPMLTQPFVENSLEHAFVDKKEGNKLKISYLISSSSLLVEVEDNGMGIGNSLSTKKIDHKSFAIEVTKSRLEKINRKRKHKLSFTIEELKSEDGLSLGTKAAFSIPLMYRDELS